MTLTAVKKKGKSYRVPHVSGERVKFSTASVEIGCFLGLGFLKVTLDLEGEITAKYDGHTHTTTNGILSIAHSPVGINPGFNEYGGIDQVITFNEKPASNKMAFHYEAKNLIPYHQPPLTIDEILDGCHRPLHVNNSIAWYHPKLGGLVSTEESAHRITTGKAFHQYAMKGNGHFWCGWELGESGTFYLIIPEDEWENPDNYPMIIAPIGDTFGCTTLGSSGTDFFQGNQEVTGFYPFSPTGTGPLQTISFYNASSSGFNIQLAVYTDGATGTPVDHTGTLAIAGSSWGTVAVVGGANVNAGINYDLCGNVLSGNEKYAYYDNAHGGTGYNVESSGGSGTVTYGTWPNITWESKPLQTNRLASIYATYSVGFPPTTVTGNSSAISMVSATVGGQVTDIGGVDVTSWGTEWGLTSGYGLTITNVGDQAAPFSWSDILTGLSPMTIYHYRSWATNAKGTSYGGDQIFMSVGPPLIQLIPIGNQNWPDDANPSYSGLFAGKMYIDIERWTTDSTQAYDVCPLAGHIANLFVMVDNPPGGGISWTFSAVNVTAGTSLSVTISDLNTTGRNAGFIAVSAGDIVQMKAVPTGSPADTYVRWSFRFINPSSNESILSILSAVNFSDNYYYPPGGGYSLAINGADGGIGRSQVPIPLNGIISKLYIAFRAPPGVGSSLTLTLYKNGVATALAVTVSGAVATTATDLTDKINISAGDYLYFRSSFTGAGVTIIFSASVSFQPTIANLAILTANGNGEDTGSQALNSGAQTFIGGVPNNGNEPTDSAILSHMFVLLSNTPDAGVTLAFTVQGNNTPTTITGSISHGATTVNDTTHQVKVPNMAVLNMNVVKTGTEVTAPWGGTGLAIQFVPGIVSTNIAPALIAEKLI